MKNYIIGGVVGIAVTATSILGYVFYAKFNQVNSNTAAIYKLVEQTNLNTTKIGEIVKVINNSQAPAPAK